MIIIKLWGGMCNQMFQYAFGYALAKKYKEDLRFDVRFYDRQPKHVGHRSLIRKDQFPNIGRIEVVKRPFVIRLFENKYISHLIRYNFGCNFPLGRINIFIEQLHRYYTKVPYKKGLDNFYDGYWQSADYFKEYEEEIRKIFSPAPQIKEEISEWRNNIKSANCVAVHIRRGDYLKSINKGKKNTIDDNTYYFNAIELMREKLHCPVFCFFSDDMAWCRQTFGPNIPNAIFVERTGKQAALFDLFAIAECDHGIMSPSTFSWWGNWLRNPSKQGIVIYPEGNYADNFITNKEWINLMV